MTDRIVTAEAGPGTTWLVYERVWVAGVLIRRRVLGSYSTLAEARTAGSTDCDYYHIP